jgi:hypothetical protein
LAALGAEEQEKMLAKAAEATANAVFCTSFGSPLPFRASMIAAMSPCRTRVAALESSLAPAALASSPFGLATYPSQGDADLLSASEQERMLAHVLAQNDYFRAAINADRAALGPARFAAQAEASRLATLVENTLTKYESAKSHLDQVYLNYILVLLGVKQQLPYCA